MQKVTASDFLNLDTASLSAFVSLESDLNWHYFTSDNSQCLVLLEPYMHQAFLIFNNGYNIEVIMKKLKDWKYLVLLSSDKEDSNFIRVKTPVKHNWKVLNLEFNYYAYL